MKNATDAEILDAFRIATMTTETTDDLFIAFRAELELIVKQRIKQQ